MSGLFGSITMKGNRLTEFASQTSTVGIELPFGFGRFPCEGNIIFAPMPPKEHVKKKKQGKGGVKTEEYSYTLSYAIAFCEGPIFGYWTIKRNGKVVYTQDPNAPVEDRLFAAKWRQKATFYYGTETQNPDSTIESYKGAGQVSGHRGVAYIVVEDDDVTDNGGAVPTYEAVIIANGLSYLTSKPYVVEQIDVMEGPIQVGNGVLELSSHPVDLNEPVGLGLVLSSGSLEEFVQKIELEETVESSLVLSSGLLESIVKTTSFEEAAESSMELTSGVIERVVQSTTMLPEYISSPVQLTSGTLEPK